MVGKKISRSKLLRWGVTREFAHYGSNDIIFGNDTANRFGIQSVLSSSPQIEVIRKFFGSDAFLRTVNTEYPLLSGARLDDVLRFRDQEWHHLHEFRRFVEDAISSGDNVDRALKDNAVQIEKIMKRNSAKLTKKLAVDAGVLMLGAAATVASKSGGDCGGSWCTSWGTSCNVHHSSIGGTVLRGEVGQRSGDLLCMEAS